MIFHNLMIKYFITSINKPIINKKFKSKSNLFFLIRKDHFKLWRSF